MLKSLYLCAIGMLGVVVFSGCCSTRFTSTIQRPDVSKVQGKACFNIVKATPPPNHYMCGSPTGYALSNSSEVRESNFGREAYNISDESFRALLCDVAYNKYPELFKVSPDSIPIEVSVKGVNSSSIVPSITAEILTLAILGGILPLPMSGTSDFTVNVKLHNVLTSAPLSPVSFKRRDVAWLTVLTPLALIPIPGESACKKTCEVGQLKSFKRGGNLSMEGFVDAVALSLNSFDLSKLDKESFAMHNGRVVAREKRAPVVENSLPDRLKKLKELKDTGVISEQEYQKKRDDLVNQL